MNLLNIFQKNSKKIALALSLFAPCSAFATIVQIQTTLGDFEINLFDFDPDTKATVDNFIAYVNGGSYNSTFFHRLVPGFVIQGGGYVYNGTFPAPLDVDLVLEEVVLTPGQANPTVVNQPKYSSVRGTIAMAKIGSDPDSATNQWFINLSDNATNLDLQNGGFTVFGQVMGDGMMVVDALAGLTLLGPPATPDPDLKYAYGSPLNELPVQNYDVTNFLNNDVPDSTNLAMVNAIVVLDGATDTAAGLNPVINELILGYPTTPFVDNSQYRSGGAVGWLFLLLLLPLTIFRIKYRYSR